MKKLISICGSDSSDDNLSDYALNIAEDLGKKIAKKGAVVVCGGHGGVMEAVCRGAKKENGITVGILFEEKHEANRYIDIAIPTLLGNIRNVLVVSAGDIVIAIGGRWGTLNEISYAMITGKKLILMKGTGGCVDEIINGSIMQNVESTYFIADSVDDAIKEAFNENV
jgi:uncharacterized protein (TIGR00725 family)